MTHSELVARAERWLRGTQKCSVVAVETVSSALEVPDAIGWKSYMSVLVECKATRADFLADRKKIHRIMPYLGMGGLRYFLTPPGLLVVEELPDKWGLLEARPRIVKVIRYADGFPSVQAAYRERPLLFRMLRERLER